jgi:glycosyltransferase involved in cell wall biosynthesis
MYLGRLSPEKGVRVLLDAWTPDLGKLVVAGDGPERARLAERIRVERLDHIALVGFQTPSQVSALLMRASMLVMPSMSPESFGLVVMEAYAHQVPVIASAIGALPHIVHQGQTGLLVPPGDAAALRQAAHQLVSDPALLRRLAVAARAEYEQQYTVQAGARRLHAVYAQALATQAA